MVFTNKHEQVSSQARRCYIHCACNFCPCRYSWSTVQIESVSKNRHIFTIYLQYIRKLFIRKHGRTLEEKYLLAHFTCTSAILLLKSSSLFNSTRALSFRPTLSVSLTITEGKFFSDPTLVNFSPTSVPFSDIARSD